MALAPDVLLAGGGTSVPPLLRATRTVPIVFANVPDPVGSGIVDSLARPGGNITGFMQFEYSLTAKWLELLYVLEFYRIEAFVRAAIETTSDEAAKPRLRRCVPPLLVAVKNWAGSPAGEVVMAAATPKAAFMFVADDWPDIDEGEFQTHEVARALVGAIESSAPNKSDVILGATAALLGEAGLDAQREEQERIADTGAVPLVVTLVEHDGRTVAVMVTVIPMPAATMH